MSVKLGIDAIKYVLKKVLTKKGVKGIATIPGKAYDLRMKQLVDEMAFKMKGLGYDINKVTQKEVQGLLDSAEAITKQKKPTPESLIKGEKYTDDRGRTWDFGTKDRPFPGWKPEVVKTTKKDRPSIRLIKNFEKELTDIELAKEGYNLQEIGILKRARNVMKKEGQNPDDALSWVRSEMADDAGIDFEDFMTDFDWGDFPGKAEGGRIGLGAGGLAKGAKWFLNSLKKNVTDLRANHPRFKVIPVEEQKMLIEGYETFIKQLEAGAEVPKEALEAISKNPQYYKTKKVIRSQDPDLAEVEELIDEKVFGHVRQELKDLETVGRKPNVEGGRASLMYGGDPGFAFEYGGSWADWQDKHRDQMPVEQYIKTKLPKDRLPFREMQSGGLAYMLGEPTYMKYGAGGSVGHAPWLKPTGQQQPQGQPQPGGAQSPGRGQPNPMKAPRGLPSLAPRTMDPAVMQQQMMQKAMMGQGQGQPRMGMDVGGMTPEIPEQFLEDLKRRDYHEFLDKYRRWKEDYDRRKDLAPTQEVAGGGRIGLGLGSMSRRAFMKMMAGIAAVPFVGKGISKVAPKAIPKVIERGADGMPIYITDLIEVVKAKGTKDFIEGLKRSDYSTVHRYKGVEVIEDAAGNTKIKSDLGGVATDPHTGKVHEGIAQEHHMQIERGEWIEPTKTKKGIKTKDEYIEGTVRPDRDGKMKDFEDGLDEAVHLEFKKVADEIGDVYYEDVNITGKLKRPKKASGGLARMLGE